MNDNPTVPFPDEPNQAAYGEHLDYWKMAASNLQRNCPSATVFQTKVLYVFGMIRHLLEAAGGELNGSRCFPAYLLACGAVELLGRCRMTSGEPIEYQRSLRRGLEGTIETCPRGDYTSTSWESDETHVVVGTSVHRYTIGDCRNLRNFMSHGMTDPSKTPIFTLEFLRRFMRCVAEGVDRYYKELREDSQRGRKSRSCFAGARVLPLYDNNGLLHAQQLYTPMILNGALPCGELQNEEEWRNRQDPGPHRQRIHLSSGTLETEQEIKGWLADAEKALLAKLKTGSVIVS